MSTITTRRTSSSTGPASTTTTTVRSTKFYVGEYAVTQGAGTGNLIAAVGEAAFMTGMERNGDVVAMASYAPLFVQPAWKTWNPNAIVFDSARTYGTPCITCRPCSPPTAPPERFPSTWKSRSRRGRE